jgi:hypothetical protein
MRRTTVVGIAAALTCAFAANAFGQTDDEKATARALGQEGQAALDKGDARTAEDRFHRAVMIFDSAKAPVPPTLVLGYARGAALSKHFIAAEEAYNRMIRAGLPPGAPAPFVKALEDAKKEIDNVTPHIARVTINVTGCDAPTVTLDGATVPSMMFGIKKPIDPGAHEIKATAAGCKASTTSFTVDDGKESTASLTLEKEATTAVATNPTTTSPTTTNPSTSTTSTTTSTSTSATTTDGGSGLKIAGIVTLGVGGAGLILGAITGGIAISDHGDIANACPDPKNCPSSVQGKIDSYNTMGALSTVGFVAGGVLAVAGIVMWVLAPSAKKTEKAAAWITLSPVSWGVAGRF